MGQEDDHVRLDLLDVQAALRAVQEPARESGVEFSDDAARLLVNDLRLVYSGLADEDAPTMQSPYVEPALLQVVCYALFRRLSKDQGDAFAAITVKDVEAFKPFDQSISKYYRTVIREAAREAAVIRDAPAKPAAVPGGTVSGAAAAAADKEDRAVERALREWVGHELIGHQRLRRQTRQQPPVQKPDAALRTMQNMYLIRDDPRPGGPPLWELSHDMLVGPVLEDNRAWRVKRLEPWQVQAEDWHAAGQDPELLLSGSQYVAASHRRREELTETEQAYLKASADHYRAESLRSRLLVQLERTRELLIISVAVNIVLLALLLWRLI